jgi:hypothetical protein
MPDLLGRSVYLTEFEKQKAPLAAIAAGGAPVFLSLHISEEFGPTYCARARAMCRWLHERGWRILADVSQKTLQTFGCTGSNAVDGLAALAEELGLWGLRLDYGFSPEEMCALAARLPIAVNASTTTPERAALLAQAGPTVIALHNFYPRPETGLDEAFLRESTRALQQAGLKVYAFVPGDTALRGPLGRGLPTLEAHRDIAPSAAFADLTLNYGLDGIFAGDPGVSEYEQGLVEHFCRTGELCVPTALRPGYEALYDRTFTCRPDSPQWLVRYEESRTYSCFGAPIRPEHCVARRRGCVTIDNVGYLRYSGEVQLVRRDLPADEKVNVIGEVSPRHLPLIDCIRRGAQFRMVRPADDAAALSPAES